MEMTFARILKNNQVRRVRFGTEWKEKQKVELASNEIVE